MIQRIWGYIIGTVSSVIGILKFFSVVNIPTVDAIIHISTGAIFLVGAVIKKGKYVGYTNFFLGLFYIGFGLTGSNLPHIIAGSVSTIIGFTFQPRVFRKNA